MVQGEHSLPPDTTADHEAAVTEVDLRLVAELLAKHRRVEGLVHRQDMPRHDLIEGLVHQQHLTELRNALNQMDAGRVARILEQLPPDDGQAVWELVAEEQGDEILDELSEAVADTFVRSHPLPARRIAINAFELKNGRLHQIPIESPRDLAAAKPIWIDLVAPGKRERDWVRETFDLRLPDTDDFADLEESARFFVEDDGSIHLRSDFLLDREDESRNVPVAFVLHQNILFSVRDEELPVFRLQRLRARIQADYVSEGKDVLLDLYAADVEYSADALEDVYAELETVGRTVLSPHVTDDEAAEILADIAGEEDLNGRIRRNVLDTRRALSFLMRSRVLSAPQYEDARQILRDIDSLDGHTSFLFGKINFLMDATVGFININQNKRVSKLTTISVVFMPINIIAGIGGMSEFSMMTQGVSWPLAYGAFILGMAFLGGLTYVTLRHMETRKARKALAANRARREGLA